MAEKYSSKIAHIKALRLKGYMLREAYEIACNGAKENKSISDRLAQQRSANQYIMDTRWEYSVVPGVMGGIKLECPECGTTGWTKNIAPLGCRTIFCDCPCSCSIVISYDQDFDWNDYTWLKEGTNG